MHKWIIVALLSFVVPAHAGEDDQKRFVNEYIREVSQIVSIRAQATKEMSKDPQQQLVDCVRTDERLDLELGSFTRNIGLFELQGPNKDTPRIVSQVWQQEQGVYRQLGDLCATFLAGPKPGVDYGTLQANAPRISARIDYLDQTMFQGSLLVAAALISDRPDKDGHLSFLIVSKKERDNLVRYLNDSFPEINAKKPKYLTGSAQVIRDYLMTRGYKMADER